MTGFFQAGKTSGNAPKPVQKRIRDTIFVARSLGLMDVGVKERISSFRLHLERQVFKAVIRLNRM
jgi:hypothetical protein